MNKAILPFLLALALCACVASKRPTPGALPAASECRWAETPPVIDGRPDDEVWKQAQVISDFRLPWLGAQAHGARAATRARLLWDRQFLYFLAEMEDADLFADVTEHNGQTWNNDVFELFFKPASDKTGYYEFQVNAANTSFEMFIPKHIADSASLDRSRKEGVFHLESQVARRGTLNRRDDQDLGWSVEGRIPWTDFLRTGGRPAPGEEWRFALCRYDYSKDSPAPELSTSADLTEVNFHQTGRYAPLRFAGPRASGGPLAGIQFLPWKNTRLTGSPDPAPPFRAVKTLEDVHLKFPIHLHAEPGTRDLLIITSDGTYGPGQLWRVAPGDTNRPPQLLWKGRGTAYGLAFHPDYARTGWLYIGYNGNFGDGTARTRIARLTVPRGSGVIDPESEQVVIEWPSGGHNGGDLVFGKDGMLYITSGDGSNDSDVNLTGQRMDLLLSKVLRIDVLHAPAGKSYGVPADNPFLTTPGARPETWAHGFRNPWRITMDKATGHIWVGENGQDLWESVKRVERGANYGWSVYEGSHPFYPNRALGPGKLSKPAAEHPHVEARSLTGGMVYHGGKLPLLRGAYLYGDYSTGRIWGIRHDGTRPLWQGAVARTTSRIVAIGEDHDGEPIIVDHAGAFYRLEPTPPQTGAAVFPTQLSQTGLFASTRDHRPNPALIPYSVNAPLWSDGAHKERFLVLPPGTQMDFTHFRGWGLPDGAALVKTFSIETAVGKPATRRRLETRVMLKENGEWAGYTYRWNEAQTDATLVADAGADEEITLRDANAPGGGRKQTWHYPSRAECLVCHSRAANFVLGLTEAQMNREHDYNGTRVNQLLVLEKLGLLRVKTLDYERDRLQRETKAAGGDEKSAHETWNKNSPKNDQRAPTQHNAFLPRNPEQLRRLADPLDEKAGLDARARAYLQGNCAHCHVESGGGNAQIDLEFWTPLAKTGLLGVAPLHAFPAIPDGRLVTGGAPESSILHRRVAMRGPGQMPPMASSVVDEKAAKLLAEWIGSLK
jgi:uncharacterized repeat protein (TIGR03806 family)